MATEQKAERGRSTKPETTPATAKANGKPKIKNHDAPEKAPIARCSTSNSHNHEINGAKSASKSSEEEEQVKVYEEEVVVVDDPVQLPPAVNDIGATKKKKKKKKMEKTKDVKEDQNKKKMRDEVEEEDGSLLYQIPMNRVSRIIKTEDPNVRITQEAVYVINKASEKFLHVFTTEAYANAYLDHKKRIDYKHLSSVVSKRKRLDFLSDFVPEKLKAEDALTESQTKN